MHPFTDHPMQRHSRILLLPDPVIKQGGVWLIRLGQVFAKPAYYSRQLRNSFNLYNFHFIKEGQLEIKYDRTRVVLGKNDMFCIFPSMNIEYSAVADGSQPPVMDWVTFDGPQVPALLEEIGLSQETPYLHNVMTEELNTALQSLFIPPFDGLQQQLEKQSLLLRMFSQLAAKQPLNPGPPQPSDCIARSMKFMHMHYMEGIGVQDVSAYVTLHRGYFSRIFTAHTGMPPVKYLEKLKMDKAAELLCAPSYSIQDIASLLSYPDPYTFTRAFTRYYGMPPGKWRKQRQEQ